MLKKAKFCNQDLYLVLLEYRNTPIDGIYSPAELLLGRKIKGLLPIKHNKIDHNRYKKSVSVRKNREQFYYNRHAKPLNDLHTGENIYVQFNNKWEQGKILNKCNRPRSYKIQLEKGTVIERNRKCISLNPIKPPFSHNNQNNTEHYINNRLSQQFENKLTLIDQQDKFNDVSTSNLTENKNDGIITRSGLCLQRK